MPVNSRRKGAKNERKLAKVLEKWAGLTFARTPSSGGLNWKGRSDVIGDVVCTDKVKGYTFPFSIETKFHEDIDFNDLIGDRNSDVTTFWAQALRDATKGEKIPLLLMRLNKMPKEAYYLGITLEFFNMCLELDGFRESLGKGYMIVYSKGYQLAILDSRDFFNNDYLSIKKLARKLKKTMYHGQEGE